MQLTAGSEEDIALSKYSDVELHDPEKTKVLTAIERQLDLWKMKMPPVKPLCLHFGLNDFYNVGETEFWIANESELGYCGKFLFVFDGQTCPYHSHGIKHETFFIIKGKIRMKTSNEDRIMESGDLLAMPPGVGHSFIGIGPALILEVSMPSILNDNFFEICNIGNNGVI